VTSREEKRRVMKREKDMKRIDKKREMKRMGKGMIDNRRRVIEEMQASRQAGRQPHSYGRTDRQMECEYLPMK
jgi:hypothetical protein